MWGIRNCRRIPFWFYADKMRATKFKIDNFFNEKYRDFYEFYFNSTMNAKSQHTSFERRVL